MQEIRCLIYVLKHTVYTYIHVLLTWIFKKIVCLIHVCMHNVCTYMHVLLTWIFLMMAKACFFCAGVPEHTNDAGSQLSFLHQDQKNEFSCTFMYVCNVCVCIVFCAGVPEHINVAGSQLSLLHQDQKSEFLLPKLVCMYVMYVCLVQYMRSLFERNHRYKHMNAYMTHIHACKHD
jgi:hypothetical protein